MQPAWIDDLLGFWFDELTPEQWFKRSDAVDDSIRRRFLAVHEAVSPRVDVDKAIGSPESALAHVILLDQLPRNMFRGTPRAFESDRNALALAKAAIGRGLDQQLASARRVFLYLPFEHAEDLSEQARSVELFTALGDAEVLRYAIAHRDIIARFGRFPHRNAVLGRDSTEEEIAFLKTPGSSF